jgi:hypothetical protein
VTTARRADTEFKPTNVETNALAIIAFVFALTYPPLAIPFGHTARRQLKRYGGSGRGLATAALVIGYVVTLVPLVVVLVLILVQMVLTG